LDSVTIAIASDLHVGGARAKDLNPDDNARAIDSDYLKQFEKFAKREGLRADYLVVPGDLTNGARPGEFYHAAIVVNSLARSLGISKKRILYVPGNHDVDWEVLKIDPTDATGLRRRQRYDPIRHCPEVGRWMGTPYWRSTDHPYFSIWNFPNLIAVGYNSAWHDDPGVSIHYGRFDETAVKPIEEALKRVDLTAPNKLKLLIIHHHPLQYKDPVPGDPDFSIMYNAESLLKFARKYRFDAIVHGHRHCPKAQVVEVNAGHPIVVLGAGSFSAQLDTRWAGLVSNAFHILRAEGRDSSSSMVFGAVQSWAFLCGEGWRPSDVHSNAILHRFPFGTYLEEAALRERVHTRILDALGGRSCVEWEHIVKQEPALGYVPQEQVDAALAELPASIGCRALWTDARRLVIVRM
jgi:predicted phosphodiesterase